jgi:serine/threonine protein kinase
MSNEEQEYADTFTGLSKAGMEPTVTLKDGRDGNYGDATLDPHRAASLALSSDDAFIGRTIGDHYQILSRLGSGGMSVVYKARHTLLHRNMAVKFLLPQSELDSKTLSRFQQEAKAAFALNHINIARVNELGIDGGEMPYIVMDFVEGSTIGDVIEKGGPMAVDRVLNLMAQACSGLEHAHSKDIIHRDIKPGNLILTMEGNQGELLKIVDFGIAKILHEAEGTQHLTQTGEVFGSPLYMSPEQAMGRPLDHRCDVYALGCVMYEALSGQPPFRGSNILDTLTKHINDDPPPLTNAPAALRIIVKKAMEKNPADRYQTMAEFRKDLEEVIQGNESKITSTIKLLIKPKHRRFVIPSAIAGATVLGVLVWGGIETAPSPRFEHRVATSWLWTPQPADQVEAEKAAAENKRNDGGSVDQNGSQSAPASSDQSAPDPMANAIPDTDSARGVGGKQPEKLERSFIDVKGSSVKDRDHLALHITDANKLYEKESPSDAELKAALADYSWAADNWNDCNATTDQNTDWDHALCESRLADCNLLTGQVEQALPHYKAANELWKKCGQPALQNVSMAGLYVAYCESKLKVAQSESTSATWDNLKTAFADNKYLGVVTQDWSNVQWNNGSPMDAEVSRIQAFMERMDASKKPYAGLPLAKPQQS